jgi:hypothetical protein
LRLRRRRTIVAAAAAATATAVAAALLAVPAANADVAGPYFATQTLGSDPHMIRCADGATQGWCLYTSRDMGQSNAYPGNYYPMQETRAYFSPNGYSNWVDKGRVFHEDTLEAAGWVPKNAYHLWAPSAAKKGNYYYLYVPDVSDISNDSPPNISTSSRIAVARSTSPFGPFTYLGTIDHSYGYMSDPDVNTQRPDTVLVWADGDHSTCGGFQSALLDTDMISIRYRSRQFITISGIQVLGDCDGAGPKTGPYVEGASLYYVSGRWELWFAAKPTSVPTECTTANGGPNTANEVIAWATSPNPQGPFTYKGIIMCGSSTEWTNQATVQEVSNGRDIIIYHDSAANVKERRLHAECLFMDSSRSIIAGVYRKPLNAANGFNDCMAGTNASYWGMHLVDPQYPNKPPIIRAPSNGTALTANRYAVGSWERYERVSLGGTKYAIKALSNGKYLCAPNTSTAVTASCTSTSDTKAQWTLEASGKLKNVAHNKYLSVAGNGNLYASGVVAGDGATVTWLYPGGRFN